MHCVSKAYFIALANEICVLTQPLKINLHAGRAGERLNAGRAEGARSGLSRRRVIMGV